MHAFSGEKKILQSLCNSKGISFSFPLLHFVQKNEDRGNCPKLYIFPSTTEWTSLLETVKILLKFRGSYNLVTHNV